jgi:hypothetical protein
MQLTDEVLSIDIGGGATTSPIANLNYGNNGGYLPSLTREIDGYYFEEYFSAEAHMNQDVIPFVIRTPKLFDILTDEALGARLRDYWINLMTVAPKKIDGLNRTLSFTHSEVNIDGSQILQQVTGSKRERSAPVNYYVERKGKTIERLFTFLMGYGSVDSATGMNIIATLDLKPGYVEKGKLPSNIFFTGTMLYVQPDAWMKNVIEAYVCGNMSPMGPFESTASREERGTERQISELSVPFTSIDMNNEACRIIGQYALDNLTNISKDPDLMPAFINNNDIDNALSEQFGFHAEAWK